jgi:molybdate transport system substrate-binding protein
MRLTSTSLAIALMLALSALASPPHAHAADVKVFSGGAFKQVLDTLAAQYEKESGDKVVVTYEPVGRLVAMIHEGGAAFDVAVLSSGAIDDLVKDGNIMPGTKVDLARVGVGVVVKAGAPLPDISTVEAFKRALLAAKSVAYTNPKAGASSGIFVAHLLEKLGIADQVNAKVVLVNGGAVADHIADGEAEIGIHQISEILPVKGVTLVGPLPAEIQNYTTYAAGLGASANDNKAAQGLLKFLSGREAPPVIKAKGMEPLS